MESNSTEKIGHIFWKKKRRGVGRGGEGWGGEGLDQVRAFNNKKLLKKKGKYLLCSSSGNSSNGLKLFKIKT